MYLRTKLEHFHRRVEVETLYAAAQLTICLYTAMRCLNGFFACVSRFNFDPVSDTEIMWTIGHAHKSL